MWKIEVDKKARELAIKNNQTIDLSTNKVGEQGDYFITLEQLMDILLNIDL